MCTEIGAEEGRGRRVYCSFLAKFYPLRGCEKLQKYSMYRGSARDKDGGGGEGRKFEWLLSSEGEAEKGSFYATASI